MPPRLAHLVLATAVVAGAGGGCSRADPGTASAPRPVEEATTASTRIDVSRIPERIDEAYVNAVLAALDQVDLQATRLIVTNRQLVDPAIDHLESIYNKEEFDEQVEVWLKTIHDGLPNLRPDPGPRRTTVQRLITADRRCVFAEIRQDLSASAVRAGTPSKAYVVLVPLDERRNPKKLNPTPWMIHTEGRRSDGSYPGDLCATG